jgi:hypothetical protein
VKVGTIQRALEFLSPVQRALSSEGKPSSSTPRTVMKHQ